MKRILILMLGVNLLTSAHADTYKVSMHEASQGFMRNTIGEDPNNWKPTNILATVTAIDDLGYETALDKHAAAVYLRRHFTSVSTGGTDWVKNNVWTQTNCVWQPGGGPNNYEAVCTLAHSPVAVPLNWYPNWYVLGWLEFILPDVEAPSNVIRLSGAWDSVEFTPPLANKYEQKPVLSQS